MECLSVYCDRAPVAKGLCSKHHGRMMKGQDFNIKTNYELTIEERFLNKINKNGPNGCWIWTGSTRGHSNMKYGVFTVSKEAYGAHRFAWSLWIGPLNRTEKRELCVCHKCDVPLCVNPDHLFLGTHDQNMEDAKIKGRNVGSIKKCKRGHEFTEKNTWKCKKGLRHCKKCHSINESNRRSKNKQGV